MAFFQLALKARKLEKARLTYEDEKLRAIEISDGAKPRYTLKQRIRRQKLRLKRKVKGLCRKIFTIPEHWWIYRKIEAARTDGTLENYVAKSFLGFIGGIFLTYIFFGFFVIQLGYKLSSATFVCTVIGVALTLGLAFSPRIRCIVFLLLPQFFSKRGRQAMIAYAFILALTGPVKNTLHNTSVLTESLACAQEQLKEAVKTVIDLAKQPFYALRDAISKVIKSVKAVVKRIKQTLLAIKRLVLSILRVITSVFQWLGSVINMCNKKLGTPFDRCQSVFDGAVADCKAKLGPFLGLVCNITYVVGTLCYIVKPLDFICMLVSYVSDTVVGAVKRKIKKFTMHMKAMFYVKVKFSHSFNFETNQSKSLGDVSTGIATEIRTRTDTLFSIFDSISFVTSLFVFIIVLRVMRYRFKWMTSERFDNKYITSDLRTIDLIRTRQEKETVLPLNPRERNKYVSLSSVKLIKSERIKLVRSAVFLGLASIKLISYLMIDYSLYWVLNTIEIYGRFESKVQKPSVVSIHVAGEGYMSDLYRSIIKSFTPRGKESEINTMLCLPQPVPPDMDRYVQIIGLIILCWFVAIFEPYGLRLRHVVLCQYYPDRAKQRATWLYNHIIRSRGNFLKFARRQLRRKFGLAGGEKIEKVTLRDRLWAISPCLNVLFPRKQKMCLLCGAVEQSDVDPHMKCPTPGCVGLYCPPCFADLQNICTICRSPVDYGDLSDISEEMDSSEEEYPRVKLKPEEKPEEAAEEEKAEKPEEEEGELEEQEDVGEEDEAETEEEPGAEETEETEETTETEETKETEETEETREIEAAEEEEEEEGDEEMTVDGVKRKGKKKRPKEVRKRPKRVRKISKKAEETKIEKDTAQQTEGRYEDSDSTYSYTYQDEPPEEPKIVKRREPFKDVEAQKIRDDVTIQVRNTHDKSTYASGRDNISKGLGKKGGKRSPSIPKIKACNVLSQIFNEPLARESCSCGESPTSCFVVRARRKIRARLKKKRDSDSSCSIADTGSCSSEEADEEEVIHVEVDDESEDLLQKDRRDNEKRGRINKIVGAVARIPWLGRGEDDRRDCGGLQTRRPSLMSKIVGMLQGKSKLPIQTYRRTRKKVKDSSSSSSCDEDEILLRDEDRSDYGHLARRRALKREDDDTECFDFRHPRDKKFPTKQLPKHLESEVQCTSYYEVDETEDSQRRCAQVEDVDQAPYAMRRGNSHWRDTAEDDEFADPCSCASDIEQDAARGTDRYSTGISAEQIDSSKTVIDSDTEKSSSAARSDTEYTEESESSSMIAEGLAAKDIFDESSEFEDVDDSGETKAETGVSESSREEGDVENANRRRSTIEKETVRRQSGGADEGVVGKGDEFGMEEQKGKKKKKKVRGIRKLKEMYLKRKAARSGKKEILKMQDPNEMKDDSKKTKMMDQLKWLHLKRRARKADKKKEREAKSEKKEEPEIPKELVKKIAVMLKELQSTAKSMLSDKHEKEEEEPEAQDLKEELAEESGKSDDEETEHEQKPEEPDQEEKSAENVDETEETAEESELDVKEEELVQDADKKMKVSIDSKAEASKIDKATDLPDRSRHTQTKFPARDSKKISGKDTEVPDAEDSGKERVKKRKSTEKKKDHRKRHKEVKSPKGRKRRPLNKDEEEYYSVKDKDIERKRKLRVPIEEELPGRSKRKCSKDTRRKCKLEKSLYSEDEPQLYHRHYAEHPECSCGMVHCREHVCQPTIAHERVCRCHLCRRQYSEPHRDIYGHPRDHPQEFERGFEIPMVKKYLPMYQTPGLIEELKAHDRMKLIREREAMKKSPRSAHTSPRSRITPREAITSHFRCTSKSVDKDAKLAYQETQAYRNVLCEFAKRARDRKQEDATPLIHLSRKADKTKRVKQLYPPMSRSAKARCFADRVIASFKPTVCKRHKRKRSMRNLSAEREDYSYEPELLSNLSCYCSSAGEPTDSESTG